MIPVPRGRRVFVTVNEEEKVTPTGIIVTGENYEQPRQGVVVAIGDCINEKGDLVPMDLELDDIVLFPHYGGTEISFDGVDYYLLDSKDILAKIVE